MANFPSDIFTLLPDVNSRQNAQALMRRLFDLQGTQSNEKLWPIAFKVELLDPTSGVFFPLLEEGNLSKPTKYVLVNERTRLVLSTAITEQSEQFIRTVTASIADAVNTYCDSTFALGSIEYLPAMVYRAAELSGRWTLLYANTCVEDFTGDAVESYIGSQAKKQLVDRIHPDDLPTVLAIYDRTKTTVQSTQLSYRMLNRSNEVVPVTEYVKYDDSQGFRQCFSIVIPQGASAQPDKPLNLFHDVSVLAQDVGLQTGQAFLAHFSRRLDLLCGAKRMVLIWPKKTGWWQTAVVTESNAVYPNYDLMVDDDTALLQYRFNEQSAHFESMDYFDLLIANHRYLSVVPIRSGRERVFATLVLASDLPLINENQLLQYIELFAVRVLREIQQTQAISKLDHQNNLLLRQKHELTSLVNLLGQLELVQCENEFIRLVDRSLQEAFSLSSRAWCFWQSGDWHAANLLESDERDWYDSASPITQPTQLSQLETVRRNDSLQAFLANQTVIWPLGQSQAGYVTVMLDFSISIPDIELMQFAKNSISLALQALKQRQILRVQAMTDSLTGLDNRNQLHQRMKTALAEPVSAALLLFDLNRFKEINDSFGHQFGDKLLREIGPRIESVLKQEEHFLARLGGDEFALYLSDIERSRALDLAYIIHQALAQPYVIDQLTFQVEASVGVAFNDDEDIDSHELLRHADVAMYAAKTTGRKVVEYELTLDHRTPHKIAVLSELDEATINGQLFVVYQPLMDAHTGGVGGLEALVRWLHPQHGFLSPAEFIPISEMGDGIRKITDFVIQESLAKIHEWRNIVPNLHVAVNLSPRVLLNKQFPQDIEKLLTHYNVPADALVLELTESTLLIDPDRAIEVIQELSQVGVKVEIDDFGTGYSSLSYLKQLPISALKIDRSFVMDLNSDDSDQVIVSSTINMAHSLGLKTVAEGVEDESTLLHLLRLGCDMIQGYYYAKPMPLERVSLWLEKNK